MTSAINPNNIDGTYPVAGQDNNSQGFRDNFTNTKTNFEFAAEEITDLQNNVLLKAPLTGTSLDNNMNNQLIYAANIRDFSATRLALGTISGSRTIDYAAGHFQTLTTSGSVNLGFTNWPAAGATGVVVITATITSTAHTLTLTSLGTWVNATGVQGLSLASANTAVITFAAAGTYSFTIMTSDSGSTLFLSQTNETLTPLNNSSEDLANGAAANLALTASYFSTAAPETGTLAAGVEGQIKVFAMYADSGDMVITVTNAGWKTSGTGTITFNDIGDGCTLQYINSKWFCIGNNGCSFA